MFLTKLEYDEDDDLISKPAIDIVKVLVNKDCVQEFRGSQINLTQAGCYQQIFVHGIIQK